MQTEPPIIACRARWVIPIEDDPIPNGVVVARAGKWLYVGPERGEYAARDLGDVAIMPALVNAHTHLEFSSLDAPVAPTGTSLADWIPRVVRYRRERDVDAPRQAITVGLAESQQHGVGLVGEISTLAIPNQLYTACATRGTIFHEALAWDQTAAEQAAAAVTARCDESLAQGWLHGVSPHAPYTVCGTLLEQLIACSSARQLPLAMHVAESYEELELIATGRGPLRGMLETAGVWRDDYDRGTDTILHLLERLSAAPRALIVHGNYLNRREREFLASQPQMGVVYCPRTHAYFGHPRYPLSELLQSGVQVAIGTDSRASNPDLSLWAELQAIAARGELEPRRILQLGTINGAKLLGRADEFGSLAVGKTAVAAVLGPKLTANEPSALDEELFSPLLRTTLLDCREGDN